MASPPDEHADTHAEKHGSAPRPASGGGDSGRLTPLREAQLLEAYRSGEIEAIGELLRGYQRRIFSICYRMVHDDDTALDLAQDAMVRVLEGIDGFDGRSKLSTWIIRVTMNCCLSHLRRDRLRRHQSLERLSDQAESAGQARFSPESREPTGEQRIEQDEQRAALRRALDALDPHARALLILRDTQGLDYQQIADVLDVPLGTVKSRLFRARSMLRDVLMSTDTDTPAKQSPRRRHA